MQDIIVIYGPTACGKTRLSLEQALARGGEIISVDSRQIYRGMDIGTGKISLEDRQGIPHFGFDLVDPDESYSAAIFARYAREKISEIASRWNTPILCGGTGLYLDSILYDLDVPSFVSDPGYQDELESYRLSHGNQSLWDRLFAVDPEYARELHPNSYPYVMRWLEVMERTGRSKRSFRSIRTPLYRVEWMTPYLGDRPALYAQIHTRIREMLDAGWIAETRSLIEQGYTLEDPGLGSIGYREIYQYIQGEITETEMYDRIAQFTRNYAKRQITWGKRYSTIL